MKYAVKKFATLAVSGALLAGASIALPAIVSAETGTNTSVTASVKLPCIDAAIDARETALIAALDPFNASLKTALTARQTALKDAWAKPTAKERRAARQAAWKTYHGAAKSAQDTLRAAKKKAWDTYKTTMKSCGQAATANAEAQGEITTSETSL